MLMSSTVIFTASSIGRDRTWTIDTRRLSSLLFYSKFSSVQAMSAFLFTRETKLRVLKYPAFKQADSVELIMTTCYGYPF